MTDSPFRTFLVSRRGADLAYGELGAPDAPAVLCLPSPGWRRSEHDLLAAELARRGDRVLALDLRGHGDSRGSGPDGTLAEIAADALAVLDHSRTATAVVIGSSASGLAAGLLAVLAPERVAGVVMIGPTARPRLLDLAVAATAALVLRPPWGAAAWTAHVRSLIELRPPADIADRLAALRSDLREPDRLTALRALVAAPTAPALVRLGSLRTPLRLVYGERDPLFPNPGAAAERLRRRLGGRAEIVLHAGLGHFPHLEDAPAVARSIWPAPLPERREHAA